MSKHSKIFVAGRTGKVGSVIIRGLEGPGLDLIFA
jgi:hypothetical protein